MGRKPPTVVVFDQIGWVPRFAYGDECQIGETTGETHGGELGTGFARMTGAWIPWTITYDEVLTVFEGRLRIHAGGTVHDLGPKDSIWLPKGTALIYEAEQALVHYAIHPVKF
ncbi:MAG: DUF861 domain-containing protein [Alphaproteobacteria bacterium]|nr:DUF861 domain-containing protein [Alphaproteobacteria bacterium]